jgi:Protein of unknown function (DUF2845)
VTVKAIACALLFVIPNIGFGDDVFRCGNSLVSPQLTVGELVEKCGKPTSQESSTQDVLNLYHVKVGVSVTEIWRYDRGSRAAPMIVTIVDGKIQTMERGK